MDRPLRAPRNRTAELQLIQRLVAAGYVFWTSDQIAAEKLPNLVQKWAHLLVSFKELALMSDFTLRF